MYELLGVDESMTAVKKSLVERNSHVNELLKVISGKEQTILTLQNRNAHQQLEIDALQARFCRE